jgi:hypothetical protein
MDIIIQVKLSISIRSAVLTIEHVCDCCTVKKGHKNMLEHCKQMLEHNGDALLTYPKQFQGFYSSISVYIIIVAVQTMKLTKSTFLMLSGLLR